MQQNHPERPCTLGAADAAAREETGPSTDPAASPSRRRFLGAAAATGTALAAGLHAPAVLSQSRTPIRIGIMNAFTGVIAPNAETNWNGMQLYFESVGWTVAGRKIELIKEDDQGNPQIGLQKARKLVESDHVDLICGVQASNVAMALLNFIKQTRTFLVVSGAGVDPITWQRIPYMFRTSLSVWQLCHPMGGWMPGHVAKDIVLAATDYVGGHDVLRSFRTAFTAGGGRIIKEIYTPMGTADYSVYLTDIRSISPPAVYSFFPGTDAVRFVQQFHEQGLQSKTRLSGFAGLVDPTTFAAQGKAALGVLTSTHYTDTLDNAENRQFVADYRAKFKSYPDSYSDYGFVAARAIAETLKATGGDATDKDRLAEAMVKVSFNAPRGPFRFDPVTHNPVQNIYVCEARDAGDRYVNAVLDTARNVQDPGVKPA